MQLEDVLCSVEIGIGYCSEFNKPLWMLSMDMSKAFGSVEHEAVLYALIQQGVDPAYAALIATLYQSQLASVNESREFSVGRGVRQGDVSSSILFNCVVDKAFQRFKARLLDHGLYLGDHIERPTNIRYADDMIIFCNSLQELIDIEQNWFQVE